MAKFGEVSWEDDFGSSNGDKKQLAKDAWLKLEEGSNVIRLVTRPHQYIVHKGVKKKSDKKGFGQKVYCSNPDNNGSCPACELGLKPGRRWFIGVIEEKSNSYKILDISYQVFSQIQNLAKSPRWGDPMKYDLDIVVRKNGGPTGYYSTQPIPHTPLSLEAQKVRDAADLDALKVKVMPPTAEQVQKRLDKILEGEAPALPEPKADAVAKPVVKTSKVTEVVTDEAEENIDDIFPAYDNDNA